jgi:hypothetical protein
MISNTLKTDPNLDHEFENMIKNTNDYPTPQNFSDIYDYSKRFINQYGIGPRSIEKIYLLGFIEGVQKGFKKL